MTIKKISIKPANILKTPSKILPQTNSAVYSNPPMPNDCAIFKTTSVSKDLEQLINSANKLVKKYRELQKPCEEAKSVLSRTKSTESEIKEA